MGTKEVSVLTWNRYGYGHILCSVLGSWERVESSSSREKEKMKEENKGTIDHGGGFYGFHFFVYSKGEEEKMYSIRLSALREMKEVFPFVLPQPEIKVKDRKEERGMGLTF